jgi:hypothetical protein
MNFNGAMNQSPEEILINGGAARMVLTRMGRLYVTIRASHRIYMVDRFFVPIIKAFEKLQKEQASLRFKEVYKQICLNLGAPPERAALGFAPCPYKGTEKNMMGLIRSWVEERSPHSRQHYFRGGNITAWRPYERPLLFVNPVLGQNNSANAWRPHTHARGRGWQFNPDAAEASTMPTIDVLNAAALLYVKKGMQGRGRVKHARDVQVKSISYKVKGSGTMHAAC